MAGTVHSGSLGRYLEELCRFNHEQLRSFTVGDGTRIRPGSLPHVGGIYAFWWTGSLAMLKNRNRTLVLHGPGGRDVHIAIDNEWLGLSTGLPVALYVGKTADSISKRVGQHLRLSQARMLPVGGGAKKAPRPTTSCQLRAGVEHLFPNEPNTRDLILDNVGLSFVELNGDDHAANRFYLEDLAIGMMRPPLNVDVER